MTPYILLHLLAFKPGKGTKGAGPNQLYASSVSLKAILGTKDKYFSGRLKKSSAVNMVEVYKIVYGMEKVDTEKFFSLSHITLKLRNTQGN